MSGKALVCRAKGFRPIEGADRIQLATVGNYQVIIGTNVAEGEIGIFFDSELRLSTEFCEANNLIRRKDPITGENTGGYFEENRRVRAVKMKGCKSEGFWCSLDMLVFTGYDTSKLEEGQELSEINGIKICEKYISQSTQRARGQRQSSNRAETPTFPRHIETEQFLRHLQDIPAGSIIYLTEKVHGTSFRYGHVLDNIPIKRSKLKKKAIDIFHRVLGRWWSIPRYKTLYTHLNGSRNLILERREKNETGYYGKEEFRFRATENIRLFKGEMIYGELVGYTDTGAPIMSPQSTKELKNKEISKQYGDQMVYKYGCIPGQTKLFVYRITRTNEDGNDIDLSYTQMLARCKELGLNPVPHIETFIYDGDTEALTKRVDLLVNGEDGSTALPSRLDNSHIAEGVVVRVESSNGTDWYKMKSHTFGMLEGYLKDDDTSVDLEESS